MTCEGCNPEPQKLLAMQHGLIRAGHPEATVTITAAFSELIAHLTGNPDYSSDRGAGTVAAKTISVGGAARIVINWPAVAERPRSDLERLLAHESGHVELIDRGEGVDGHRDLVAEQGDWGLLCLGAFGLEEFRIERGLVELGYPPAEATTHEHISDALMVLNGKILEAVLLPGIAGDVEAMARTVISAQDHFVKVLAYTAAAHPPSRPPFDPDRLDEFGRLNWQDFIAGSWHQRTSLYETLPDAWSPCQPPAWTQALLAGLEVEKQFLTDLGFRYQRTEDTTGFWRTGSDERFDARVDRYKQRADEAEQEE